MDKRKTKYILLFSIIVLRIWIGEILGVWFPPDQYYDDALMINYANFLSHFSMKAPLHKLLLKEMAYPLFLNLVHISGLKYTTCLSICWILAAVAMYKVVSDYTNNKVFLYLTFIFVLFNPAAFDLWLGTRVYRNAIIAPFLLLMFCLMLKIDYKIITGKLYTGKNVLLVLLFGIVFSFAYYIKEDGIWMMACLLVNILICSVICIGRSIKRKENKGKLAVNLVVFLMPMVMFIMITNGYKAVNNHYFGVYETNTRTSGELGEFVKKVYKIEASDRTPEIWASQKAIKKAFKASPTLQKYPDLLYNIEHTPWFGGDIQKNPIQGDFLTWVLRDAIKDAGLWTSEKDVSELFHQVNKELDEAFEEGRLKKDKKIQLVSSMGGRSLEEILSLKDSIIKIYKINILLEEYKPGGALTTMTEEKVTDYATMLCNMNLYPLSEEVTPIREKELDLANRIVSVIFNIYSKVQILMCLGVAAGFLITVFDEIKKRIQKKENDGRSIAALGIIACFGGVSFAYAVSICWFCCFLDKSIYNIALKFYGVGMIPLMVVIELIGVTLLIKTIGRGKKRE